MGMGDVLVTESDSGADKPADALKPANSISWFGLAEDWVGSHIIDPAKAAINSGETKLEQMLGVGEPITAEERQALNESLLPQYTAADEARDRATMNDTLSPGFLARDKAAFAADDALKNLPDAIKPYIPNADQATKMLEAVAVIAAVVAGLYGLTLIAPLLRRTA